MIYTLDYVQKEAEGIAGAWNGKDKTFQYNGDLYPAEQVDAALELLEKLTEVKTLMEELSI